MAHATVTFPIWSTTAMLVVTRPSAMKRAAAMLDAELAAVDDACNRFRADSELMVLLRTPGQECVLTPLLNDLISAALRISRLTGGLVDPTVAAAVISLGYDRDISAVRARDAMASVTSPHGAPAPGIGRIRHEKTSRRLMVPAGVGLDLGATAKAVAADRAAARIAAAVGGGVLVNLGGDIAVAGETPVGGWPIAVAADHRTAQSEPEQVVCITGGGIATSSTVGRTWQRQGRTVHHIVDPRTGTNPDPCWRMVTAVAGSALDANAATTAAIVLGAQAPDWLADRRIPARLSDHRRRLTLACGWPAAGESTPVTAAA